MRVAINQPNFAPWYPFFDLIKKTDKFFILDNVYFTKESFITRTTISNNNKILWVSIPIQKSEKKKLINKVCLQNDFKLKLFRKIKGNLNLKKHDHEKISLLEKLLINKKNILAEYNTEIIKNILNILNIKTEIVLISDYIKLNNIEYETTGDLIKEILKKEKCSEYYNFFNGIEKKIYPYNDKVFFSKNKIKLYKQNPFNIVNSNNNFYKTSVIGSLHSPHEYSNYYEISKLLNYERIY